jgi:hypothetical protein
MSNVVAKLEQETNPYADYGKLAASRMVIGLILKFAKGEYTCGADAAEIPIGTRVAALLDTLEIGWKRWQGGRATDSITGRVADRFMPPTRRSLGDLDESLWEVDHEGRPRDPWQMQNQIHLVDQGNQQVYQFCTSSAGGKQALAKLCSAYSKEAHLWPGQLPIVELGCDAYMHREKAYGKIRVPTFPIVGWDDEGPYLSAFAEAGGEEPTHAVPVASAALEKPKMSTVTSGPNFKPSGRLSKQLDDDIPF